jgi:restriction endonuclease Mrr
VPIPDYQTLMLPVLRVAAKGETTVPPAADEVAGAFGLSQDEREELLPSGRQRVLHNRIGRSGDGWVDGVVNEDVLGLDRVYVQAKRYAPTSTMGRPEIQAFTGSLVGLGASKGVFVTT